MLASFAWVGLGHRSIVLGPSPVAGSTPPAGSVLPASTRRHETPPRERLSFSRFALGQGRTISMALDALGLEGTARQAAVAALSGVLDPRRLRPETGFTVGTDESGRLRLLAVRPDAVGRWFRLRFSEAIHAPSVESLPLPTVTSIETAAGIVTSSVARALPATSEGIELTLAFADLFQWDVDLLVEPRHGDQVRVVYEVVRLGERPDELPEFAGGANVAGSFLGVNRILAASYEGEIANSSAYWVDHGDGTGGYYDTEGKALRKTFLKSPLNYRRISSGFSRARRHPVTRKVVPHHGVDFAAPTGTPVVAAADGRVVSAGWDGALGQAVRVRHGSNYETVYGHLSRIAKGVRPGTTIRQNEVLGYVGATGRATGPHLHYTLIERGRPIDPMRFDNPAVAPLPPELSPRLTRARLTWSPVLEAIPVETELAAKEGRRRAA